MVSIVIPCYEMHGKGVEFLDYGFTTIMSQIYKDYEVVVTDHSQNDLIEQLCNVWKDKFRLKYIRVTEKRGNPAYNTNQGIKNSSGDIIKFLYQDDYLYDENSLKLIVENFDDTHHWLVSDYIHTRDRKEFFKRYTPTLTDRVHLKNLIGAPSCVAVRNSDVLYYDENVKWVFDCEYYKRMAIKFGEPVYLRELTMVNYIWDGQVSGIYTDQNLRIQEKEYIAKLYGDIVREDEWD